MLHCNQFKSTMPRKHKGRNNELDRNARLAALSMLNCMTKFTQIAARDMEFVAEQFGFSQGVVAHLWRGSKTQWTGFLHKEDAETKRHNCQPPRKWDPEAVQEALKELPWNQRKNVRSAASKLGIAHSTLQYMKKTLVIQ